jgi:hypothetical protein
MEKAAARTDPMIGSSPATLGKKAARQLLAGRLVCWLIRGWG